MACLRTELTAPQASGLFVRGMADAIAVHLARHYVDVGASQLDASSLPAYKLRIDTARRMLRETHASIVAIANEVGYANPSHFAQLFRKETGLTPSDYRRQR